MISSIRSSLRSYVMMSLLAVGAIVILAFSVMSWVYFFAGIDGGIRGNMIAIARSTDVTPGNPKEVLGHTVAARWEDLDPAIQSRFDPAKLRPFELYKKEERPIFLVSPDAVYFVIKVQRRDSEAKFVSQAFVFQGEHRRAPLLSWESWLILIALGAMITFAAVLVLLMRRVSKPVERLSRWADQLNDRQLDKPIPNFRFEELNHLAEIIHKGLSEVSNTLKREQEFVRHASHELRTPIAVIRSSIELLSRLDESVPHKGQKALKRIDNASHTMVDLTETLLWLSKQEKAALHTRPVRLDEMVTQVVDDLTYLLASKPVTVDLHCEEAELTLPPTACRIVLTNIVRNAFQHTLQGEVTIRQQGNQVRVVNEETHQGEQPQQENESGYGLGLQMVSRLTGSLGWGYTHVVASDGHRVELTFPG